MVSPLERRPEGNYIMISPLDWHRGYIFFPLGKKGKPKWHLITFSALEGDQCGHFIMFQQLRLHKGRPRPFQTHFFPLLILQGAREFTPVTQHLVIMTLCLQNIYIYVFTPDTHAYMNYM